MEDFSNYNQENEPTPSNQSFVDRHEKRILIGLGVFAVLVVILALSQIFYNLAFPYRTTIIKNQIAASQYDAANPLGLASNGIEDATLKAQDTDSDGISDYDELNVYNTSPYLDDSDSDGIKDLDELNGGTDPNCPKGKDCSISLPSPEVYADTMLEGVDTQISDQEAAIVSGSATPDQVRQFLITNGIDAKEVDALTDDQVRELYQNVLSQMEAMQQQ